MTKMFIGGFCVLCIILLAGTTQLTPNVSIENFQGSVVSVYTQKSRLGVDSIAEVESGGETYLINLDKCDEKRNNGYRAGLVNNLRAGDGVSGSLYALDSDSDVWYGDLRIVSGSTGSEAANE